MTDRLPKFPLVSTLLVALGLVGWGPSAGAVTTISIGPANTTSITAATGHVTVPIKLSGFVVSGTNGAKNFSVTIQLSAGLRLYPNLGAALTAGPYLAQGICTGGSVDPLPSATIFQDVIDPTIYTVNGSLHDPHCACGVEGVLFNVEIGTTRAAGSGNFPEHVNLIDAPAGSATTTPFMGDCALNALLAVQYGAQEAPIAVNLCLTPLAAPTVLTATTRAATSTSTQLTGSLAKIDLTWLNPSGSTNVVDVWRAPFGRLDPFDPSVWINTHPEYDENHLFTADAPIQPTGAVPVTTVGWTKLTPTSPPHANDLSFTDDFQHPGPVAPVRGYWYYVMRISDGGTCSLVSLMSNGALNYLLGDVAHPSNGQARGDNKVDAADVSRLGNLYGAVGVQVPDTLDIGPTMSRTPFGRPHPDDRIDFEDLIILSMNWTRYARTAPQFASVPAPSDRDELTLDAPAIVRAGEAFTVVLRLMGASDLQGVSTQLGWDAAIAEPQSVQAGGLALSQDGVVLSSRPGNIDVAVLGGDDRFGLTGEGVLATVSFVARANGDPQIGIANVDARNRANQKVDLTSRSPRIPSATTFGPPSPNPFNGSSTFHFSLAKAGSIELAIFSVDGRRVKTLSAGNFEVGSYRATWNGTDGAGRSVRPGLFFAQLVTAEGRFNRSIVKVK